MNQTTSFISFLMFCLAMTGTPGPNNLMVLAGAARGGLMGAGPLIFGIACGSALQMATVGAGVGTAIAALPSLHFALSIAGGGFLAWIAVRIALSGPLNDENGPGSQLLGFWGGTGFQWINPKAWAVTTGAAATYLPGASTTTDVGMAAVILAVASLATLVVWAVGGSLLRDLLRNPRFAMAFNLSAASILLASILVLAGGW